MTDLNFDPDVDGELAAALNLGLQPSPGWEQIWKRYADSPAVYPGVKARLRQAQPGLFPERRENWPGVNAADEDQLRNALADLTTLPLTAPQRNSPAGDRAWLATRHALGRPQRITTCVRSPPPETTR